MAEKEQRDGAATASQQPAVPQRSRDVSGVAPEQADQLAASGLVNTAWSVNFRSRGGAAGKHVSPRTPSTSMYLDELKVSPEGAPGQPGPEPHRFHGVTLAPTGAANVGSFGHPRDRAGLVSAAVSFGAKPQFDFTLSSQSRGDVSSARKEHGDIVRELTSGLDDFVDEAEAQAVLDRVLAAHLSDPSSHGKVKRIDKGKSKTVNTSDLKYGPVGSDRSFKLRVDVPTVVKDKSASYSTSAGGETINGEEHSYGTQTETETSTSTSVETQRLSQVENHLRIGVTNVVERFFAQSQTSESVSYSERTDGTENTSGSKLNSEIKGGIDLVPDIPVIGWIAKKLIGGRLEINMSPSFHSSFTLSGKRVESETGKGSSGWQTSRKELTGTEAEQFAKHLTSTTLKSAVTMAVKVRKATSDGGKQSDGSKDSRTTSTSTTVGTVHVVSTSDQPILVEE